MDQLADLRKQRHAEYLAKREIELEKERIEKEKQQEYDRLNPKAEVVEEEEEEESQVEDQLEDELAIDHQEDFNENNNEDEDFSSDEEDEDQIQPPPPNFNFNGQIPHFQQPHYNQPPQFPPIFNPNLLGGGGGGHFNNHNNNPFFGGGGFQSYSGQGHQLSSPPESGGGPSNNPSNANYVEPSNEPTTGEQKRSTFLNSIEQRYTKSPELVSINNEIDQKSKKVTHRIPKDYTVKKLIDLCLSKMTIELTLFQSQLKLMSGELIQRLIELMVSTGRLTRTKMNQIVSSGARIYSLDLSHQYAVTNNDFLLNCFKFMVEIQAAYFRNCTNITDVGMEVFKYSNFEKNLKILDLRDNRITDIGVKNLKNLINLEELYLGSTLCTDLGLALLRNLTKLKTLDISKCKITDKSMDTICLFSELRFLYLSGTQVTDIGISKISKLPNLVQLYLSQCLNITNQSLFFLSYLGKTLKLLDIFSTKIGLNGFIHLKMFKQLQYLVLPGRDSINDATIGHLNVLTNLRKLDLSDYIYLTDISPLTSLQQLTELLLSNTKIDDKSIVNSIKTMNSLQVLSLNRTEVTNEGVAQLINLNLQSLSLSSTKIDGNALHYLGQMKSLQNLNISFNDITDNSMDSLKPIADTLTHLDLRGTDTFRSLYLFNEKIVRPPVIHTIAPQMINEEDDENDENGPW